jgi:hypothetical protein
MLHGKKDVALTIKGCISGDVYNPKSNETNNQYQILFEESDKKLILNKTNLKTCVKLFGGSETDNWIGRRIAVYAEWIKVGKDTVLGVRIRDKEPPPRQPTRREAKAANGKSVPLPPEETRDPVEVDLLAQVNAQCGGHYKHINHLLNGAKRANPDIDPDNLADPTNIALIIAAAVEYANVPPEFDAPTAEQPALLSEPEPVKYE